MDNHQPWHCYVIVCEHNLPSYGSGSCGPRSRITVTLSCDPIQPCDRLHYLAHPRTPFISRSPDCECCTVNAHPARRTHLWGQAKHLAALTPFPPLPRSPVPLTAISPLAEPPCTAIWRSAVVDRGMPSWMRFPSRESRNAASSQCRRLWGRSRPPLPPPHR